MTKEVLFAAVRISLVLFGTKAQLIYIKITEHSGRGRGDRRVGKSTSAGAPVMTRVLAEARTPATAGRKGT